METTKTINIGQKATPDKNTSNQPPGPKKRIVTSTESFTNTYTNIPEEAYQYIEQLYEKKIIDIEKCNFIQQQIRQKLYGYRGQDTDKKIFDADRFIKLDQVLKLMMESKNQCYYCKEFVHVLYENVREPKQWTLDRINNKMGHNEGNLLIACLNCNLRRRTMHTERYVFTKQLNIKKVDD